MDFDLKTITDFDFGIGPSNDVVRVSEVPKDVTSAEVNLILWLILEHEFGAGHRRTSRTQYDGGSAQVARQSSDNTTTNESDNVDCASAPLYPGLDSHSGHVSRRSQRVQDSQLQKARKYAEQLLRKAGINLPFDQLNVNERRNLFQQFSASSELLRGQNFGSVLDLFHALRERSKLKEEYDILQPLGTGNYGDVYSVMHRKTGLQYAAKRLSLTLDNVDEIKSTLNESALLKSLKHPNIVQCYNAWLELEMEPQSVFSEDEQEPLKFYVLMDHCYQSLHQWIAEVRKKPDELLVMNVLKQIVNGIHFIHSNKILHLDINPKNIMWMDPQQSCIKIGDFGLAIKGEFYAGQSGTFPYYAPEETSTSKSDLYSIGVTIFEVAENIQTTNELYKRLEENEVATGFSLLNGIIPSLLHKNPLQRPSALALKELLDNIEINIVSNLPSPMITA